LISKVPFIIASVSVAVFTSVLVFLFLTSGTTINLIVEEASNPYVVSATWTTIYPAVLASILVIGLSLPYAWIVNRTDVPGRRILRLLPFIGLTVPAEIRAIGFVFLFSPQVGIINQLFKHALNVQWPLFNIFSNPGLALAVGTGGFPFNYILFTAAIRGMDSSLEESARVTGSPMFRTIKDVILPQLKPALLSTFAIDIVLSAAIFDYAFIFGSVSNSGVNTLATTIYDKMADTIPPDYGGAGALSFYYLVIAVVGMTFFLLASRRQYRYRMSRAIIQVQYRLTPWQKRVCVLFCSLVLIIAIFLLVFIVSLVSFLPYYSWQAGIFNKLTLGNYYALLFTPGYNLFYSALENSFFVAFFTALATGLLATFLSYAAWRNRFKLGALFEYFYSASIGIPSVVYGAGIFWTFLAIPGAYGSIWALLAALIIVWVPYSIRIVSPVMLQIPRELEEASEVSGAVWLRTYRMVLLPTLKGAVLISFVYVFLDAFRELGAVTLLTTPQTYVLTTFIADLFIRTSASYTIVSAIAVVMVLIMTTALFVADHFLHVELLGR
jgi:iron(III) transport system permease protein